MRKLTNSFLGLLIVFIFFVNFSLNATAGDSKKPEGFLQVVQVDVLDRIFPDLAPEPMKYTEPTDVPRGGNIAFQFAVTAKQSGSCKMSIISIRRPDGKELACQTKLYNILPVPVEDNAHPFGQRRPYPSESPT